MAATPLVQWALRRSRQLCLRPWRTDQFRRQQIGVQRIACQRLGNWLSESESPSQAAVFLQQSGLIVMMHRLQCLHQQQEQANFCRGSQLVECASRSSLKKNVRIQTIFCSHILSRRRHRLRSQLSHYNLVLWISLTLWTFSFASSSDSSTALFYLGNPFLPRFFLFRLFLKSSVLSLEFSISIFLFFLLRSLPFSRSLPLCLSISFVSSLLYRISHFFPILLVAVRHPKKYEDWYWLILYFLSTSSSDFKLLESRLDEFCFAKYHRHSLR